MLTMLVLAAGTAFSLGVSPVKTACEPLRVMTYNIRLDLQSDGENRWWNRRDQFTGQIALMRPAILGLQEVLAAQKADLERALPEYEFIGVAREDGRSGGEFSNIAFDRNVFRVRSSGTFWLSETPERPSKGWDAAYKRIATWAHLDRRSDGARFLAVNTHLDNEGRQARLEGARQISGWISANRQTGEAILLTGDFNSPPTGAPMKVFTSTPLALRDARTITRTPAVGPEGTWNSFVAIPPESPRIDFILVDPSLSVERYGVLAWHGEGGRPASDHFPVVADLESCRR